MGHSQCDGDSMHARIEQHCSKKSVYSQEDWCKYMREAKVFGEPYSVKEIQQSEIFDFEGLAFMFNWPAVKTSNITKIMFKPNDDKFYIQYGYEQKNFIKKRFFKKNFGLNNVKNFKFRQLYDKKIPLPQKKIKDLNEMIKKKFIPDAYHNTYFDLINILVKLVFIFQL